VPVLKSLTINFVPKESSCWPLIFIISLFTLEEFEETVILPSSQPNIQTGNCTFQMALNHTVWPSTVTAPEAIKEWLSTFYRLADTNDSAVIEQMVDLFAENAVAKTAAGQAKGKAGKLGIINQKQLFPPHLYISIHAIRYITFLVQSTYRVSQAFRASRKTAWDLIETRKHEVLNVYIAKEDFSDILLIGKLAAGLKNGKDVVSEFVAHLEFTDTKSSPKATLYEVWTVRY
jgi:hypothetical protein